MPWWKKSAEKEDENFHTRGATEYSRGMNEYSRGNLGRALSFFNLDLEVRPGGTETLYHRGLCYAELGELERAKPDFAAVIRSSADRRLVRDAAFNLGRACEPTSDALAVEAYGQALEIDPGYSMALCNRGGALLRLSESEPSREARTALLERALADSDAALAVDDSEAIAHWNRATACTRLERPDEAVPALEAFVRLADASDPRVNTAQDAIRSFQGAGSGTE